MNIIFEEIFDDDLDEIKEGESKVQNNEENTETKNATTFLNGEENKSQKKYFDLLPDDSINDPVSFGALDEALSNEKIRNIALTGNYGSGKSSILKSYIKSRTLTNCIEISLASFGISNTNINNPNLSNTNQNDETSEEKESEELGEGEEADSSSIENETISSNTNTSINDIETSILQQIVYKKSESDLPNSRLARIKKASRTQINAWSKEIIMFALSIIFLFATDSILEYIFPRFDLDIYSCKLISFFVKIVSIILVVKPIKEIVNYICKKYHGIDIRKISLKSAAEIELSTNFHDSVLNRRLDEILYFFECCPEYDIVIFEDLDRFNNPEIFTRLRELNLLLNGYEKLITEKRKRICFIYALRDEMFLGTERVKFFDFILPVIPVINSTNSADILLKESEKINSINKDFLSDIGLFINDMRLLKNIINEYQVYVDKLKQPNHTKIFSMVLYKNLFPNDFSKLQLGESNIIKLFNNKSEIYKKVVEKIDLEISELNNKIETSNKECLLNVKDLRKLYITQFFIMNGSQNIPVSQIEQLSEESNFKEILNTSKIKYEYLPYRYVKEDTFNFVQIQNSLGHTDNYLERETAIKNKSKTEIDKLQNQINERHLEKNRISSMSLQELFEKYPKETTYYLNKNIEKNNRVLFYLLSHGYIDENYSEYVSYFYEGQLTQKDNEFLISVRIKNPLERGFELSNIKNLVGKIRQNEWEGCKSLLNFSLLNFLLDNSDNSESYKSKLISLMKLISNEADLAFFKEYIENPNSKFLNLMFENCSEIWQKYQNIEETEILNEKALFFVSQLEPNNISSTLQEFIKNNSNEVLQYISKYDIPSIVEKFYKINMEFPVLPQELNLEAVKQIAHFNLFKITNNNIQVICKTLRGDKSKEKCLNCISIILSSADEETINFIEEMLEEVLNDALFVETELKENETVIALVCASNEVTEQTQKTFLHKNTTVISDINIIPNKELWNICLEHKTIYPSWNNILYVFDYNDKTLTDSFVDYINETELMEVLTKEDFADDIKETVEELYDQIYMNYKIKTNSLKYLVKRSKWKFCEYKYEEFDEEKIEYLIDSDSIVFDNKEFNNLKQHNCELAHKFLVKNIDSYLEKSDSVNLEKSDVEYVIAQNEINVPAKKEVFLYNHELLLSEKDEISNEIVEFIVKEKIPLTENEIVSICSSKNIIYDNKIIFLISQTQISNNKQNFMENLSKINTEFSKLKNKKSISITKKSVHEKLYEQLHLIGIATSKKEIESGNKLKINLSTKYTRSL